MNDQYYLVGGVRNDFALVDGCSRFDLATSTLSDVVCPMQTRLSGTLVELYGKLYLVGGSAKDKDNLLPSPDIDVFDPGAPAASSWSRLAYKLPFNTRRAHVLSYGERILIVSTHNDEGRIRIGLLDVSNAPATPAVASPAMADTRQPTAADTHPQRRRSEPLKWKVGARTGTSLRRSQRHLDRSLRLRRTRVMRVSAARP